jgi:hypothetical protein
VFGQRLFADKTSQRGDAGFVFLDEVGGLSVIIERALRPSVASIL